MHTTTVLTGVLAMASYAFASPAGNSASCTTTILEGGHCCPPSYLITATKEIDCHGCALQTNPGVQCDIICPTPRPVSPGVTTVTSCKPSGSASLTKRASPSCTKTVTSSVPFGCTRTSAGTTKTSSIDCDGCALTTTTVLPTNRGIGPECVGGYKTVTDNSLTATATVCSRN